jgi:hypothetical protein
MSTMFRTLAYLCLVGGGILAGGHVSLFGAVVLLIVGHISMSAYEIERYGDAARASGGESG